MDFPITKVENVEGLESQLGLPVGFMYFSLEKTVPVGRIPAQGATYNRELYADLWAYAQKRGLVISESEWQAQASANDGNCAFYSDGDGSTTFRVPSIKCWVKGADGEEVGSYLEAGLPNATGRIGQRGFGDTGSQIIEGIGGMASFNEGVTHRIGYSVYGTSGQPIAGVVDLDLSKSNSIYGNSDTVQPPSIVGQWLIVAFGTASNVGNADVANVMQAVERVQTGLGQVDGISDYIIESYRNGTEWYEVYKSGKVRQGGRGINATEATTFGQTVTLLKEMRNTDYKVIVSRQASSSTDTSNQSVIVGMFGSYSAKTTTSFNLANQYNNSQFPSFDWEVEGQGA